MLFFSVPLMLNTKFPGSKSLEPFSVGILIRCPLSENNIDCLKTNPPANQNSPPFVHNVLIKP